MSGAQQSIERYFLNTAPAYLVKNTDGMGIQAGINNEFEWACTECNKRVTRNRQNRQYGHGRDCRHWRAVE